MNLWPALIDYDLQGSEEPSFPVLHYKDHRTHLEGLYEAEIRESKKDPTTELCTWSSGRDWHVAGVNEECSVSAE